MRKFIPLKVRFLLCYLGGILIPILLFSSMIYRSEHNRQKENYLEEKKKALTVEQSFLNSQIEDAYNYFNQLKSDYALMQVVKGGAIYPKDIVYAYNSQLYSTLNSLVVFDDNLNDITVYTENTIAAELLRYFEPLENCPISGENSLELYKGFWQRDNDGDFSFFIGFPNPPMTIFPGILRLNYNSSIFDDYAKNYPEDPVLVYMDDTPLFSYHSSEAVEQNAQKYLKDTHLWQNESTFFLEDTPYSCSVSCISVQDSPFRIIIFSKEAAAVFSRRAVYLIIIFSLLILCCASLLMFFLILNPMKNIIRLADHMNSQNSPMLTPYREKITNDETGSLILSFNEMAKRINELSENLLRNELLLRNAQIEVLQTQLNPHFFYGTLESIRMIAEANGQELISDIAYSFGNLMRYSLSREYLVPVSKEIEITEQYISIQEKRLINRFSANWRICEFDDKWRCPKFVLFGMVENVFSHNVSKCREFIRIEITVEVSGNDMLFTVINTGPGIPPKRLEQLRYLLEHPKERASMESENNGRSIFNIHDRLRLFYGDEYSFSIDSLPGEITTCRVRINRKLTGPMGQIN